jgi:hypothetical protein
LEQAFDIQKASQKMPAGARLESDLLCALRPGRFSPQAHDRPRTVPSQLVSTKSIPPSIGDIAARLSIEPPSFELALPSVADAPRDPPGMLDRDNLELEDEQRQWVNEISVLS